MICITFVSKRIDHAKAENLEANDFLSNLTPARDMLFGAFQMESSWQGRGLTPEDFLQNLEAGGTMRVRNGEIQNIPVLNRIAGLLGLNQMEQMRFREMWSGFSVANGRVGFDNLEIQATDADWTAAGSVGFDGSLDYDISVTLSEALSSRSPSAPARTHHSQVSTRYAATSGLVVFRRGSCHCPS